MTLMIDFTAKLQTLCHDGYSLAEVEIDTDGNNERFANIEIRRLFFPEKREKISLVPWRK